ncbi:hypothetical protein BO94DRAFT_512249 [Aspergillus sclerotioniger CBS 115572]|uniref:beta-glucosidase n=1 Tax=Aspergillus sclerotioniger CBS 115572 TaxID=1450535 RepID=A0A317X3M9_9EURO|nr:hypothetical protein BO94DRAFT_512249 [Aspergillus sclerotioniger CBS 115572]PWY93219.1 hypothetical protein BO94DRAFT_512249 [Aspergillus sclerotioniger CBS 115572]
MTTLGDGTNALLYQLTLEEKISLLSGKNMWETHNIDRLNIPSLKTTDGPAGVRGAKWIDGSASTCIPCGISLAASFDPALVERTAFILGAEAKAKGSSVLLAPTMNMSRSPLGGRNFENFGEDPFLTGSIASAVVKGIQSEGVGACVKHFVANDLETRRYNLDEDIDERTLREVYLRPFEMALKSDPWTLMTSYQKVNGEHVDTSEFLLRHILRSEWGFDGLVMSDWGGCNDTVKSLTASMDLEMPGPSKRRGHALLEAVKAGHVSEKEYVDPSVRRVLQLLNRAGLLSLETGSPSIKESVPQAPQTREADNRHDATLQRLTRDAAIAGLVLLKNDSCLPLEAKALKSLAIVGHHAKKPTVGGAGSASVHPYYISTPYDSLVEQVRSSNPSIDIQYAPGLPGSKMPPLLGDRITSSGGLRVEFFAGHQFEGPVVGTTYWKDSRLYLISEGDVPEPLVGKPFCYRVHGTITADRTGLHAFGMMNTGNAKLYVDNTLAIDNENWTEPSGHFMGCASREKQCRMHLTQGQSYEIRVDNVVTPPPVRSVDNTLFGTVSGLYVGLLPFYDEEGLMHDAVHVAQAADCTIVVVGLNADEEKEGGDRTSLHLPSGTDELITAVSAISPHVVVCVQSACAIAMPWADQVGAIVQAWYQGQENGNALADALLGKVNFSGKLPVTFPRRIEDHPSYAFPPDALADRVQYGEGVLIGYRHFDKFDIDPRWPFGFGLSYSTFRVSEIQLDGCISLSDDRSAVVSAVVTNTGGCDGQEVVQVYTAPSAHIASSGLSSYVKALAGFQKVFVPTGGSRKVSIRLSQDAVRWFDVQGGEGGRWRVDLGSYQCFVGTSSRHIAGEVILEVTR